MSRTMKGRMSRSKASKQGGLPSLTERQVEAYLLSRDTLRRIQRTSAFLGEAVASGRPTQCDAQHDIQRETQRDR